MRCDCAKKRYKTQEEEEEETGKINNEARLIFAIPFFIVESHVY